MRLSELKWRLQRVIYVKRKGRRINSLMKAIKYQRCFVKNGVSTRLQFLARQDSKHMHTHTYERMFA